MLRLKPYRAADERWVGRARTLEDECEERPRPSLARLGGRGVRLTYGLRSIWSARSSGRCSRRPGSCAPRFFITNVVKARPPGNRDPRADEVVHYWPWLKAQLDVLEPKLIVPLGRHALSRFAPKTDRVSEVHGRVLERDGLRLFPLYRPAAALHNRGSARLWPVRAWSVRGLSA